MTILLATNDVLEAERECDRVAFLHEGRLVAEGTPAELKQDLRHDSVLVECADGAAGRLAGAVAAWPEVGRVRVGDGVLHVSVEDAPSFVPRLFSTAGDAIRAVRIEPTSLEDAYFQLVGSSLRASGSGERSAPRTGSPRHRSQTMPPTSVGGGAHNSPTEERA